MTDPRLVRRLALDLRNLADKTLELRGAVEDYRHDVWSAPSRTTGATGRLRPSTARSRSCGSSWIGPRPSCAATAAACRRSSGSNSR